MEKQVFYFSDSPVAALASGLSDPFAPRAVPRSKPPRDLAGAAHAVGAQLVAVVEPTTCSGGTQ